MCPVCVSVLLSHTVLSKLYQKTWVTKDEMERMKREELYLPGRLVIVQYTKPPNVLTGTADALDRCGYKEPAKQLKGWLGSQTTQQQ